MTDNQTNETEVLLVLVTCPEEHAEPVARSVIESREAACVNIIRGVRSVYRWEGLIEEGEESALIIKTTSAQYSSLESRIVSLHPYACPEIIAVKTDRGLPEYLNWVARSCVSPEGGAER